MTSQRGPSWDEVAVPVPMFSVTWSHLHAPQLWQCFLFHGCWVEKTWAVLPRRWHRSIDAHSGRDAQQYAHADTFILLYHQLCHQHQGTRRVCSLFLGDYPSPPLPTVPACSGNSAVTDSLSCLNLSGWGVVKRRGCPPHMPWAFQFLTPELLSCVCLNGAD